MEREIRAHLTISGRVQGVCYRMETQAAARRIGVGGWVKNKPDGTVEAVVEGERTAVEALIAWCRRGPPGAMVTDVTVVRSPCRHAFTTFDITY